MPRCSPCSRPSSGSPTSPSSRSSASVARTDHAGATPGHHRRGAARDRPARRQPRRRSGREAMALQLHAGDAGVPERARRAGALHGMRQMPRSFVEVTVPEDRPRRRCRRGVARSAPAGSIPTATSTTAPTALRVADAAADAVPPGARRSTTTASSGPPRTPGTSSSSRRRTPPTTWRRSAAAASPAWPGSSAGWRRPLARHGRARAGSSSTCSTPCDGAGLPEPERQHPLVAAERAR